MTGLAYLLAAIALAQEPAAAPTALPPADEPAEAAPAPPAGDAVQQPATAPAQTKAPGDRPAATPPPGTRAPVAPARPAPRKHAPAPASPTPAPAARPATTPPWPPQPSSPPSAEQERAEAARAASAFVRALAAGDADALAALCAERFSFDGDPQSGREAVRRTWRAILTGRAAPTPAVGRIEVLSVAEAVARHGPPPTRIAPLARPGALVAIADVGGRTVVLFIARDGGRLAVTGMHG